MNLAGIRGASLGAIHQFMSNGRGQLDVRSRGSQSAVPGPGFMFAGLNITKTDVSVEGIWRLYPQYSTIYSWMMWKFGTFTHPCLGWYVVTCDAYGDLWHPHLTVIMWCWGNDNHDDFTAPSLGPVSKRPWLHQILRQNLCQPGLTKPQLTNRRGPKSNDSWNYTWYPTILRNGSGPKPCWPSGK